MKSLYVLICLIGKFTNKIRKKEKLAKIFFLQKDIFVSTVPLKDNKLTRFENNNFSEQKFCAIQYKVC